MYRGTSPIRPPPPLESYSWPMRRALWWSQGVGVFLWARYPCSAHPLPSDLANETVGITSPGVRVKQLETSKVFALRSEAERQLLPLFRKLGTDRPVKARFWPGLEPFSVRKSLNSFKQFPAG